jgi:hypothetical protein
VVADFVLDCFDRAEDAERFTARGIRRHPPLDVLLDQHVEVIAELGVQLPLQALAPKSDPSRTDRWRSMEPPGVRVR